jgi:hypothetical protein
MGPVGVAHSGSYVPHHDIALLDLNTPWHEYRLDALN